MLERFRVLVMAFVVACGGHTPPVSTPPADATEQPTRSPDPVTTPPPSAAHVRLIHAAVESSAQAITLAADGQTAGAPTAYQFSSAELTLTPGDHAISARAGDAELIQASLSFRDGPATVVAYSTGDFPAALALLPDRSDAAPEGASNVRFFHAIVGTGAIDVCVPPASGRGDGTRVLSGLQPGTLGSEGYVSVPGAAELVLQLRAAHSTACHGRVIGLTGLTPAAEANYTLIFVGRTAGRQRVAPELLFCADPPAIDTSCATAPIASH